MGNVDVDYATGSFCSSRSILPPTAGGLWWFKIGSGGRLSGAGEIPRAQYHYIHNTWKAERPTAQRERLGATAGPFPVVGGVLVFDQKTTCRGQGKSMRVLGGRPG